MVYSLLPRVRVNYTFKDIIKSLFIKENKTRYSDECVRILSSYYDNEFVALVPSSRSALYELLIRLPQKKVVIPAYTCMVVNEAVLLSGKDIIFSSNEKDGFNALYLNEIDYDSIVIATHQYGLPCNIEKIANKCKEVGAVLIEDCATSMGTRVNGKLTGTFGDYAIVSLNASKTLTVPPFGGILIGKQEDIVKSIGSSSQYKSQDYIFKFKALLRAVAFVLTKNIFVYKAFHWITIARKGKLQRTEHEYPSKSKTEYYNYKFSEWQAYILLRQLHEMDQIFAKRMRIYKFYNEHISNPFIKKPLYDPDSVCTRYAISIEDRKSFYDYCISSGIDLDFSHSFIGAPRCFKNEHLLASRVANLPFYYDMKDAEMIKVVEIINSFRR